MELTREEAIRNFREHWASLAITGVDYHEKDDYLKRNGYGQIINSCFLCHYTHQIKPSTCNNCPIEWPETYEKYAGPQCMRSHYGEWLECADPEERSRLAALIRDLPEKAEKMEETRPTPKYQIGDKVVPINKTAVSALGNPLIHFDLDPYWERGKEQGYLFIRKVLPYEHVVKNGQFVYSCSDVNHGIGNYYCESDLTPYVEPLKCKFKVGDKVRIIAQTAGWAGVKPGDVGTIKRVPVSPNGDYGVDVPTFECDNLWEGAEECFDLVSEPKAEPKPNKFSVGDKVKCIRVYDWKEEALGKIGKIIDVHKADNYYTVQFDEDIDGHSGMYKGVEGKDGYCWCFEPDYLELVKPDPQPAFKVGDRVRVKSMEQIKSEFPLNTWGSYQCGKDSFTNRMTDLCGKSFVIKELRNGHVYGLDTSRYNITPEMLEPFPINNAPENKTITEDNKTYMFKDNKTTCILDIDGRKFKGVAKCAPDDKWSELTGMNWSQIRAKRAALDYAEALLRRDF